MYDEAVLCAMGTTPKCLCQLLMCRFFLPFLFLFYGLQMWMHEDVCIHAFIHIFVRMHANMFLQMYFPLSLYKVRVTVYFVELPSPGCFK